MIVTIGAITTNGYRVNPLFTLGTPTVVLDPGGAGGLTSRAVKYSPETRREDMGRLEGKVAVITGGGSGIGAGTVRRFVEEGAKVLIADLDEGKGDALAVELGADAAFLRTDVSKEEDIAAMMAETVDRFGRIDVLFNNAGFGGALGPIESTSLADYDLTMDVLLKSVFLGMKHVAPLMKAQRSGSIISTASVAGSAPATPHLYSVARARSSI